MTRVLIIDDQRIAREYMESVVKNGEDYELVGSLSQADLAATVCRRSAVDLVLMDVCTEGGASGLKAVEAIRKTDPEVKIIVMTAFDEITYIPRARAARSAFFPVISSVRAPDWASSSDWPERASSAWARRLSAKASCSATAFSAAAAR